MTRKRFDEIAAAFPSRPGLHAGVKDQDDRTLPLVQRPDGGAVGRRGRQRADVPATLPLASAAHAGASLAVVKDWWPEGGWLARPPVIDPSGEAARQGQGWAGSNIAEGLSRNEPC